MKNDTVIDGTDNPIDYLQLCRTHMKDTKSDSCKLIFRSSEQYIKDAQQVTKGKIQEAFATLRGVYGND